MIASDNPACSYAAIRYSTTASDTYYKCVTGTGSAQTVTAIGTTAPSATSLAPMSISIGASSVTCTVGGTSVTNTTNLPTAALSYSDIFTNTTLTSATTHLRLNGVQGVSQNGTF
jgi:hypothetical protein